MLLLGRRERGSTGYMVSGSCGLLQLFLFLFLFLCWLKSWLFFVSLKMALTLVSILIVAVPVVYCYPTAFQDLEESSSKYHFTSWAVMISCEQLYMRVSFRSTDSQLLKFCFIFPYRKQNLHKVPGCRRLGWSALSPLYHCCAEGYGSRNESDSRADGSWLCSGPWR